MGRSGSDGVGAIQECFCNFPLMILMKCSSFVEFMVFSLVFLLLDIPHHHPYPSGLFDFPLPKRAD
jgi:hypothetical protein